MQLNLQDKCVLISGGAKGIGAVAARSFRDEGAVPVIPDSDEEAGNRLMGELKSGEFIGLDLRDEAKCKEAIASVIGKYGALHVLVNNAGVNDMVGLTASREEFVASLDRNLMIAANVIHAAFENGVKKLPFLASNCIYPKFAPQPIPEGALLTGPLEPTNEPYAIAKIAGLKRCESYNRQYGESHGIDYRALMPCNLYGPGDNYHPESAHVVAGLIRRFHEAKVSGAPSVTVWGTGAPRRECLHVDDVASACVHVMNLPADLWRQHTGSRHGYVNVGPGEDITIAELARSIATAVGYEGRVVFDPDKPDGTPRKLPDNRRLAGFGWRAEVGLEAGLASAYQDFLARERRR